MSVGQEISGTIEIMTEMREVIIDTLANLSSVHFIRRRRLENLLAQYDAQIAELRFINNAWYRD